MTVPREVRSERARRGAITRRRTLDARFWDRVDRSGGPDACWPWLGGRWTPSRRSPHMDRYGVLSVNHLRTYAHRRALELATGQSIPAGQLVRHSCDNPPCCNPAHLSTGTHADNAADMVARGRSTRGRAVGGRRRLRDDDTRRLLRAAFAPDLSPTDATSSEARDTLALPPGRRVRSRASLAAAPAVSPA